MRRFFVYLAIFIITLVQVSFVSYFPFFGVKPNLVLGVVFALMLLKDFKDYWAAALVAGIMLDLFSGWPFGILALSLIGACYLIDRLKNGVFGHLSFGILILLGIIGSISFNWLALLLAALASAKIPLDLVYRLFYAVPLEALYNLILIIVFYYGLEKISRQKQIS